MASTAKTGVLQSAESALPATSVQIRTNFQFLVQQANSKIYKARHLAVHVPQEVPVRIAMLQHSLAEQASTQR